MVAEDAGETPSLTGEFTGETHRVLECTQAHPHGNQHQKCPICLWVAEEVTERWPRAQQVALFPFGPLPHIQCHNTVTRVASFEKNKQKIELPHKTPEVKTIRQK